VILSGLMTSLCSNNSLSQTVSNVYDAGVTADRLIASPLGNAMLAASERLRSRNRRSLVLWQIVFVWATLVACTIATAQDPQAKTVLQKYKALRPSDQDLAMYRLDWANSFEEAKQRAAKEGRPIFLVIIHAKYGDISSGHC